jgi:acyl-CoA thioester hydrolase
VADGGGKLSFTLAITAQPADIDELGHVNNAVWVQWVQRIALAHWYALAPAEDQAAYFWVITRHEIDYRGNVSVGETVTGETWVPEPPRGARFNRHVRFTGGDGRVKVEAVTTWAIIDRAAGRIIRVPAHLAALFLEPSADQV